MKLEHSPPKRILIVRISALGDIVFCTSLLEGLRKRYPDAHIAWLAEPAFAAILEGDPRLNEILPLPKGALRSIGGLRAARVALRKQVAFDWVIDAQGLLKSRLLARSVKAKRYVGFQSKEPGGFMMHELLPKGGDVAKISSEYRYLATQLTGADPGPPRLMPPPSARERAQNILESAGLTTEFIALCPFTTRPQKHWLEEHWGKLAHQLTDLGLGRCALMGGPQDREAANRIMLNMPSGSVDLVGATPLADVPAVIETAKLVIGVDTGLTHIGIALRRPVIALFGSTRPYLEGAESSLRVLFNPMPCAPCKRKPTCGGRFDCMRDLSPEQVLRTASEMIGSS